MERSDQMARKPLEKLDWAETDSSNVEAVCFDEPSQTICVRFKGGGVYSYIGASMEVYMNFLHADSVGKYLNNVVKAFPYTRWESEEQLIAHLNV